MIPTLLDQEGAERFRVNATALAVSLAHPDARCERARWTESSIDLLGPKDSGVRRRAALISVLCGSSVLPPWPGHACGASLKKLKP
jgi:hypothetical protein